MGWHRVCKPKDIGGLGFRDLRHFNPALLGRQGWRLMLEPGTPFFKVFSSKYYPNRSFLDSEMGSNLLFVEEYLVFQRVDAERNTMENGG